MGRLSSPAPMSLLRQRQTRLVTQQQRDASALPDPCCRSGTMTALGGHVSWTGVLMQTHAALGQSCAPDCRRTFEGRVHTTTYLFNFSETIIRRLQCRWRERQLRVLISTSTVCSIGCHELLIHDYGYYNVPTLRRRRYKVHAHLDPPLRPRGLG